MSKLQLRVRAEISSQIFRVEAPGWQGAKGQEYLAYSELSQRSQPGCIGAKNVKLFLREPLARVPFAYRLKLIYFCYYFNLQ